MAGRRPALPSALGRITSLATRRLSRPLRPAWEPGVDTIDVVVATLRTSQGLIGSGFAWTPGVGSTAIEAVLQHDLRPLVLDRDAEAAELWPVLHHRVRALGPGGPGVLALAALDLALWDVAGRAAGLSVTDLIGRRATSAAVYRSGINLFRSTESVVEQATAWASAGAEAVKIKVGRADLAEDVDRVRRVRQVIGPRCRLMVDANQRWDLQQADAALAQLSEFDLAWVEEPLGDGTEATLADLRRRHPVPIAAGESLWDLRSLTQLCRAGVVDIVQPNVVRMGGITPFLQLRDTCESAGRDLAPHLLPELSAQLAMTCVRPGPVELVDGYTFDELDLVAGEAPVVSTGERLTSRGSPGIGLTFLAA